MESFVVFLTQKNWKTAENQRIADIDSLFVSQFNA